MNEIHKLLKLPRIVSKRLNLNDKATFFVLPEVKPTVDSEEDVFFDENDYTIQPDGKALVPVELSIVDILDRKAWFDHDTFICNTMASKYKEPNTPYIDPDLEDGLIEKGGMDEYIFLTNPVEVEAREIELANDQYCQHDLMRSYDNILQDLALRIMRLYKLSAASQIGLMKHTLAYISIRQAQLKVILEHLSVADIVIILPPEFLNPIVLDFDQPIEYLQIIRGIKTTGKFIQDGPYIKYSWVDEATVEGLSKKMVENRIEELTENALDI